MTATFGWSEYQALHGDRATLLLALDPRGWTHLAGQPLDFTPEKDWTLVSLIETEAQPGVTADRTLVQTH
ncbi:hypothetical protein D3C80_2056030 [compost metagenome]